MDDIDLDLVTGGLPTLPVLKVYDNDGIAGSLMVGYEELAIGCLQRVSREFQADMRVKLIS